jgi:SAM-dependent methyltransferase
MSAEPSNPHAAAQEFFDKIADDYTARSKTAVYNVSSLSFSRRQDIVTEQMLKTPKGGTILDYGMGPAVFGPAAAQNGLRYIGIDISPKMIDLARQMNLPNAEYHQGDLDLLDKFRNTANTVLLIGLIDYLQDPEPGLRKLSQCVKPGGRLIMSFRNHNSIPRILRNSAKAIWRGMRPARTTTDKAFSAPVLENSFVPAKHLIPVLESEGFGKVELNYLDCSPVFFNVPLPKPVWQIWKQTDKMLSQRFLSFMCASGVLVARNKQ